VAAKRFKERTRPGGGFSLNLGKVKGETALRQSEKKKGRKATDFRRAVGGGGKARFPERHAGGIPLEKKRVTEYVQSHRGKRVPWQRAPGTEDRTRLQLRGRPRRDQDRHLQTSSQKR